MPAPTPQPPPTLDKLWLGSRPRPSTGVLRAPGAHPKLFPPQNVKAVGDLRRRWVGDGASIDPNEMCGGTQLHRPRRRA